MTLEPKSPKRLDLDNPQMPMLSPTHDDEMKLEKDMGDFALAFPTVANWREISGEPCFDIGIVIYSSTTYDRHISAISRPASMCTLKSLVVLEPKKNQRKREAMRSWLRKNRFGKCEQDISIGWGQEGFDEMLKSKIAAVYIIVPPG